MLVDVRSVVLRAGEARRREQDQKWRRAKDRVQAEKDRVRKKCKAHNREACAREGCAGVGPLRYGLCPECYNILTGKEPHPEADADKRARPNRADMLRAGDMVLISQLHPERVLRGQYGTVIRPEDDGHAALVMLTGRAGCNPNDVKKYEGQLHHVLGALLLRVEV